MGDDFSINISDYTVNVLMHSHTIMKWFGPNIEAIC